MGRYSAVPEGGGGACGGGGREANCVVEASGGGVLAGRDCAGAASQDNESVPSASALKGEDVDSEQTLSKGERLLEAASRPQVAGDLPAQFRAQEYIMFDTDTYDLRRAAAGLLRRMPELDLSGCFREADGQQEICLEALRANDQIFRSFQARQRLREHVSEDSAFLSAYERLVVEVLCPHLEVKLRETVDGGARPPTRFVYQYPPTLRIQPGPSESFKRPHRDAEYGHQVGEVNFWMPLTNYSEMTRTTLWVESSPNLGDYKPLDIDYGSIAMFHGTLCRHSVPANASLFTRVSMDFRIGVGDFFDPAWSLEGVKMVHGRRELFL